MSRVAPTLEYLVIYNKSLQAALNVSNDDDDAQEEAHILFYTCRPGGVKRDKMLRQVGLAKALISFSETFTNGDSEACEMVHSARTKLVMISPEKDYWIHASVNVAYTESKNKDGTIKKEYHETSVHDVALKTAVIRGYREFRLLYGTLSNLLEKGRETLERRLEKFFSVWAWKWDLEQPAEFISHLGTPVSPYNKYMTPLIDELRTMLPEDTPVLLLSSRDLLASHPSPSTSLWSLLPLHLIRLIPSHEPTPSEISPSHDPTKALVKTTKGEAALANQANMDLLIRMHGNSNTHGTANFLTAMNPRKWGDYLTFSGKGRSKLPTAQEALSTPPPEASGPPSVAASDKPQTLSLPTPSRPDVDQKSLEEAMSSSVPVERTIGKGSTLDPRQTTSASTTPPVPLFAPALEYLSNAAGGLFGAMTLSSPPSRSSPVGDKEPSDVHDPTPKAENPPGHEQAVENTENTGDHTSNKEDGKDLGAEAQGDTPAQKALQDVLEDTSANEPPKDTVQGVEDKPLEEVLRGNAELDPRASSSPSSRRLSDASLKSTTQLPPPEAFFVPLSVYLEDPETKVLRVERVFHMAFGGLMLALIMNSPETIQSPTDTGTISSRRFASFGGLEVLEGLGYPAYVELPRGLEYKAVDILKRAKQNLERLQNERVDGKGLGKLTGQSPTTSNSATLNGTRNFAVTSVDERTDSVLASLGFSSTAGWLFEGQATLRRDEGILEQFSRTTTSQNWYISKRIPGAGTVEHDREIHMEVSRKESNLIDVDNDLNTIVRRLEAMAS